MSICPRCGTSFECGMADGAPGEPCWCARLPALPAGAYLLAKDDPASSRCFCAHCLRALLAAGEASEPEDC